MGRVVSVPIEPKSVIVFVPVGDQCVSHPLVSVVGPIGVVVVGVVVRRYAMCVRALRAVV